MAKAPRQSLYEGSKKAGRGDLLSAGDFPHNAQGVFLRFGPSISLASSS